MDKDIERIKQLAGLNEEHIPFDGSMPMKLARDLYRGSKGDVETAKKMAQYLYQQIVGNIDKHAKKVGTKRIKGSQIS